MDRTMLISAVALVVLVVAGWALSVRIKDVSIVDVVWGLGFVLVAVVSAVTGDGDEGRRVLLVVLTALWGLRLAGYIARRKLKHPGEDPRYTAMRRKHGDARFTWVSLGTIFLFQGFLIWAVSQVQQGSSARDDALGALDWIGVALWAVGLAFEAIGDAQLARFKADPDRDPARPAVMDRGLWRYTRHPNYFGDFTVWWGFGLIAVSAGAYWGLVGPLIMTLLLTRVSGKDHLERSMSKRPGYAEYVERTSGFFPLPPRGSSR